MDTTEDNSGISTVERHSNDDKDFCSFYYRALKGLLDINDEANVSYLHRYFKILCEYCDIWCRLKQNLEEYDDTIINLLKGSLYYVFACVYRNAALLSSAVAYHFRNAYKKNPTIIDRLLQKKIVKICSFGGCAASDIVALVRVLESVALENRTELDFRVTIIESDERWKVACIAILSCLQQFHKATWKITFVRGNCTKKDVFTSEVSKATQGADIVTMTKLLSKCFLEKNNRKEILDMVPHQALLFILDHPLNQIIDLSFDLTYSDDFELIHKDLFDFHSLDIEAVYHFQTLYQKHFGNHKQFQANLSFNLFIGVWIKTSDKTKSRNKMECIFKSNVEKFNPKLSILNCNAFTRRVNWFKKQKEADGWNEKGIKKFVQEAYERRQRILVELFNERKKLDIQQKVFSDTLYSLKNEENESNETFEKSLKSYLTQKSKYALTKRAIYYNFLNCNKTCPVYL